uniref:ATP-dependent Clp protease proteolytic subunit n=1 Tax=Oxandra macrophylla TaxID=306929 RepID=UPI002A7F9EFF|nr:ATP-dependent Clp protease proteolytic subunit [Oxandra macrophylla]YP_010997794.1 ATP-dependent Clp protease proteolytic subunit [Oxandra martiana]YP_010997879.1 ATP-dependent Clp protease proteolytic subunit [Oxandra laurifolia]YP_010997964.1 ATP-dependent Clp protease proteolytic subunit [Oxandra guianensis]WOZ09252.1 ATP-dependent Clp protease proteolytic subunit [Oxandra macrophylla]WPF64437.1 ATP-dependent Clp protease proteolytic subunit [Oxandra martiana]WPF64522.1 ATP-dependent Cl
MPVGLPRVPFRIPGDEDATWVDIYNRLYRERFLFLGQDVDDEISNQLAGIMIYLGIEDETRDIFLFINSPGGYIIPGFGLFDTMQWVQPEVYTICLGLAASMGSFLLVGGEITKRIALPYAWIMIHQPASSFFDDDDSGEIIVEINELMQIYDDVIKVYAQRTGAPLWVIAVDIERDVFLSAEEAQKHGLVDLVGIQMDDLLGFRIN